MSILQATCGLSGSTFSYNLKCACDSCSSATKVVWGICTFTCAVCPSPKGRLQAKLIGPEVFSIGNEVKSMLNKAVEFINFRQRSDYHPDRVVAKSIPSLVASSVALKHATLFAPGWSLGTLIPPENPLASHGHFKSVIKGIVFYTWLLPLLIVWAWPGIIIVHPLLSRTRIKSPLNPKWRIAFPREVFGDWFCRASANIRPEPCRPHMPVRSFGWGAIIIPEH